MASGKAMGVDQSLALETEFQARQFLPAVEARQADDDAIAKGRIDKQALSKHSAERDTHSIARPFRAPSSCSSTTPRKTPGIESLGETRRASTHFTLC